MLPQYKKLANKFIINLERSNPHTRQLNPAAWAVVKSNFLKNSIYELWLWKMLAMLLNKLRKTLLRNYINTRISRLTNLGKHSNIWANAKYSATPTPNPRAVVENIFCHKTDDVGFCSACISESFLKIYLSFNALCFLNRLLKFFTFKINTTKTKNKTPHMSISCAPATPLSCCYISILLHLL